VLGRVLKKSRRDARDSSSENDYFNILLGEAHFFELVFVVTQVMADFVEEGFA
jgi:hypothetical protein